MKRGITYESLSMSFTQLKFLKLREYCHNRYLFRPIFAVFYLYSVLLPGCATVDSGYTTTAMQQPSASIPYALQGPPVVVPQSQPFSSAKTIIHVVGPSETLWRISRTYNVDMQSIMKANKLSDPTKISNGQKLTIPNTLGPKPVIPLYPSTRWTYIVIHHTATDVGNAFSIDEIHHKRGFWNGLGYHFLIDNGTDSKMDGQIEVGPRWIKQMDGAHANADGMNQRGIGISIVGNYSEQRLSSKQMDALVFLTKTLQNYYKIPARNVIRHSDVPGKHTECPGLLFPWSDFRRRISN